MCPLADAKASVIPFRKKGALRVPFFYKKIIAGGVLWTISEPILPLTSLCVESPSLLRMAKAVLH